MAGSNISINTSNKQVSHETLNNRNQVGQHILESIYDSQNGQNLKDIIDYLKTQKTSVTCEYQTILTDSNVLTLNVMEYNIEKDLLYVSIQGIDVFEGTDKDYVKTNTNELTFNYDLKVGYEVFVMILGTISNASFGDSIYSSVTQFKQLSDTPSTYYGQGNKVLKMNDEETGLVFSSIKASLSLTKITTSLSVSNNEANAIYISIPNSCLIKGIKVIPDVLTDVQYAVSLFTMKDENWVYYSGTMYDITWDIMDIPYVTNNQLIYLEIKNWASDNVFNVEIYEEE